MDVQRPDWFINIGEGSGGQTKNPELKGGRTCGRRLQEYGKGLKSRGLDLSFFSSEREAGRTWNQSARQKTRRKKGTFHEKKKKGTVSDILSREG